jgi:hypothetical protein
MLMVKSTRYGTRRSTLLVCSTTPTVQAHCIIREHIVVYQQVTARFGINSLLEAD